jgi:hypothetical protein
VEGEQGEDFFAWGNSLPLVMSKWAEAFRRVEPGEEPPPPPAELVEIGWSSAYGATLGGLYGALASLQGCSARQDMALRRLIPAASQSTLRWSGRVALFASVLPAGKHACSQALRSQPPFSTKPIDFVPGGSFASSLTALTCVPINVQQCSLPGCKVRPVCISCLPFCSARIHYVSRSGCYARAAARFHRLLPCGHAHAIHR